MKILILGSTGLVGSSLVKLLQANKKYEVIGATRNAQIYSHLKKQVILYQK